jgi:hypothetical protein
MPEILPSEAQESSDESITTFKLPPKAVERADENSEEISWEEAVRLFREKVRIWIKRTSGRWNEGYITDIDEDKKRLMVVWEEPNPLGGVDYRIKGINFNTYKEWRKEAPILPLQRARNDGDED